MIIEFKTESGSQYRLDSAAMTWERLVFNPEVSPYVRTRGGKLCEWPEVVVGRGVLLVCPPIVEGAIGRVIMTTHVTEVTEL